MCALLCPQFIEFITGILKGENPKFIELVHRRWDDCRHDFRSSSKMEALLEETRRGMETEKSRMFVHFRNFVNVLKANGRGKKSKVKRVSEEADQSGRSTPAQDDGDSETSRRREAESSQSGQPRLLNHLEVCRATSVKVSMWDCWERMEDVRREEERKRKEEEERLRLEEEY